MTPPRRPASIHLRKKPRPADVLPFEGSHLDKAREQETFFGMMFTAMELLRSLPWPGIKTEVYPSSSEPQTLITFPFATSPINEDKEEPREIVCKRMKEYVRIQGLRGVPQEELKNLLLNFDPWYRTAVEIQGQFVTAMRTALNVERKRLRHLERFLSDPPAIYPFPPKSSTALAAYVSQCQRKLNSDEQTMQQASKLLASARRKFVSKKSSHLSNVKSALLELIRKSPGMNRHRAADELAKLLSAWNANLAGKKSSLRIASYRR